MGFARLAVVAAAMACLLSAAPAWAQTTIDSPDMEVDVGSAGDLDANFNTDGFGQVIAYGSAGLQIDVGGTAIGPGHFTADTAQPQTIVGTGTPSDPFHVTTAFYAKDAQGNTLLHVVQHVTHITDDPRVGVHTDVQNVSGNSQPIKVMEWGEVAGGGFAAGSGTLIAGPPRFLAGAFPTTASVSGLEEETAWDHYEEADDAALTTQLAAPAASLDDTVSSTTQDDPAVGAEWDRTLNAGDTASFDVAWRFVPGAAHIDLQPGDGSGPPEQLACFMATVTDVYGRPVAVPIEFSAGDPHPSLDTITNPAGQAAYCTSAAEAGEELFVDADVPDALLDGFANWEFTGGPDDTGGGGSPPEPVAGSRLTARVVAGTVKLRHGTRYTAIKGEQSIKVGSTLDARHGTVELTAEVGSHEQTGRFGAGIFHVRQASESAPVALALTGSAFGPACKPGSHKAVRRLRATTDRGHWQTVARQSVAGVAKAASWVTQDRCDGTLTVVRTGTATVRPTHGHAASVRAGHRRLVPRPKSG